MTKPVVILDPNWRRIGELFSDEDLESLESRYEVLWGRNAKMPDDLLEEALPEAFAYVSAVPRVDARTLALAPRLKLVAEVAGAFPDTIDYHACADRGIEVLCCAPGFRQPVAEMALAMMLAGARGLVDEHERFRSGEERWLDDNAATDFSLHRARIGIVGYGSIARELHRLLVPFEAEVLAHDPWLPDEVLESAGARKASLDTVMSESRCVVVAAVPTSENRGMIDADALALMQDGALLVLVSRAHLVDFPALVAEAESGRIRVATDVYPTEPVAPDDPIRGARNVVLSPHRAAAVANGRRLIGSLLLQDLDAVREGRVPAGFLRAAQANLSAVAGVGDAKAVGGMALRRS